MDDNTNEGYDTWLSYNGCTAACDQGHGNTWDVCCSHWTVVGRALVSTFQNPKTIVSDYNVNYHRQVKLIHRLQALIYALIVRAQRTWRNNNVIVTSKRRRDVVLT